MARTPTGIDAEDTVVTNVQLANAHTDTWAKVADGHAAILERIREQPGVLAVGGPPVMRFEVVGVVRDIRNAPLGRDVEPAIHFSMRQFPFRERFIAVRATDRATASAASRNGIASAAPRLPFSSMTACAGHFAMRMAEPRLLMTILVFFGALAALLAAFGVYKTALVVCWRCACANSPSAWRSGRSPRLSAAVWSRGASCL